MTIAGLADYHLHTPRCHHASGSMEEYLRAAMAAGLGEIGFSDHLPFPKPGVALYNMARHELPGYVEELELLREKHRDFPIRLGIEADFLPGHVDALRDLLSAVDFDYVVGSVHYLEPPPGDHSMLTLPRFWSFLDRSDRSREEAIVNVARRYHEQLRLSADSGLFDVMGHCDLPRRFGHQMPPAVAPEYRRTAQCFADNKVIVELNTSGLRNPVGEIYPGQEFLRILSETGVPITLGSDAHKPKDVAFGFDQAVAWAREAGYEAIQVMAAPGHFEPRPIV